MERENNPFNKNQDVRQSGKVLLNPGQKVFKFKMRFLLFGYAIGFPMGMFVALGLFMWLAK